MKTKKLSTIATLTFILNAYNEALRTITKGGNSFKINELGDLFMSSGVCYFCQVHYISLPNYIINRNVKPSINGSTSYWGTSPYILWMFNFDPMEGIISRVIILEKELKHHKKWGFLARYIKP